MGWLFHIINPSDLKTGLYCVDLLSFTFLFPIDANSVKTAIMLEMPANPCNHVCHIEMVAGRDLFPINKPGRRWQLPDSFYVRLILNFRRYNEGFPIICLVLNNRLKQAVFPGFPIDTYTPHKRSLCMRTIPKREFVFRIFVSHLFC